MQTAVNAASALLPTEMPDVLFEEGPRIVGETAAEPGFCDRRPTEEYGARGSFDERNQSTYFGRFQCVDSPVGSN